MPPRSPRRGATAPRSPRWGGKNFLDGQERFWGPAHYLDRADVRSGTPPAPSTARLGCPLSSLKKAPLAGLFSFQKAGVTAPRGKFLQGIFPIGELLGRPTG